MSASQTLSLPDNAPLFTRLRVASQCLKVLKHDAGNPTAGQTFNLSLNVNVYASLARQLQRSEEGRRLLSKRPSLQGKELDLAAMERLLFPFETTLELKSDIEYLSKRYRETHDLLHVLTGYRTDVVGEMELQAYCLGNLGLRTTMFVLLNGTLGLLKEPQSGVGRSEYLRRAWAAYQRGRASPRFLDFWFEEHWETPVATLRARLCAPANG